MAVQTNCPICDNSFCEMDNTSADGVIVGCAVCGTFKVARSLLPALTHLEDDTSPAQRAAISHRLRTVTDQGQVPLITTYDFDLLKSDAKLPSPGQQAINLIQFIGDNVSVDGKPLPKMPRDIHAIVGAPNREFAMGLLRQLRDRAIIEAVPASSLKAADEIIQIGLTLDGWSEYDAEQKGKISGDYGFIALKFGDAILDPFLRDVIKPTVSSVGYTLEDMRDAARAGIIDNVMRARIRDSRFVLVDLTHANEGAYWEAGYAEGLGKPVLYLCNRSVFEEKGTHFDTNHCTTILWDHTAPEQFVRDLTATLRNSLGVFSK